MATSKELLKAQEAGAEIRITIAGQPDGGIVEYSPRHKGDRLAWVYADGSDACRYAAKDVAAVTEQNRILAQNAIEAFDLGEESPAVEAAPVVTQEMIDALATLRDTRLNHYGPLWRALRTLYAAGVFAHIDAAADAKQEQASECNCIHGYTRITGKHMSACPEDTATDAAADGTVQCGHCRGDYKPKKDGTLRKHTCWHYDQDLKTIVYGELDIHDRAAKVAKQERARVVRNGVGLKF